ncbi:dihydrofolate reductase family protein [Spiractinospora alimapuensis]|uniref:dihydrofolate reductase family protein n=1 Tax=Spiractinospora alimapuensis TaxID=2820884 RepID=UPI001F1AEFC1|nr:dihydrofolate reductase family protein [Spiractinospora alimapuensis]QVQ50117.1 dihydrofolate reductase family protein [Spiractinospora alimapuensis]
MSDVIADISMSLDGYVTGPEPGRESGLGRDGEAIQRWVFSSHESPQDRAILEAAAKAPGAVIMGRNTFDFVDGPNGWNAEIGFGYDQPTQSWPPVFVVTHAAPEAPRLTTGFTFVTDGIDAALKAARDAAGGREVVVMGGASVIDQALAAGLVNRLRIHLSPVVMGSGTRLFDLVDERVLLSQSDVVVTPNATHLTYEVN